MGFKFACAKAAGGMSTWGLRTVLHRPAGFFPGKLALRIDPSLLAHLAPKLSKGSILVVGTNGKTTTTLMLAQIIQESGQSVICNRTGANLDSGVATVLMQEQPAQWGVFEVDELWLAHILPQMRSKYVVLLDLFPDQEDRTGGVAPIQESIVGALKASPETVLVYNADDPHCAAIAKRAGNPAIALGTQAPMGLSTMEAAPAQQPCDLCGSPLAYDMRQYDQLGSFHCPACGWERPAIDAELHDIRIESDRLSFALALNGAQRGFNAPYGAAYMAYNLGFIAAMAQLAGCPDAAIQHAFDTFNPGNGRLLQLTLDGRRTLVNLAKNPAGFDQNLRMVIRALEEGRPCAVAFFVNNKEGDGRDPSWLDDVSFESLAEAAQAARVAAAAQAPEAAQAATEAGGAGAILSVTAGGMCTAQLHSRLERAGLAPVEAQTTAQVLEAIADMPQGTQLFLIANYTALPAVRDDAKALAARQLQAASQAAE